MLEQAPARTCGPMERGAHTRAGLLAGFVTLWGTHAGAACEELQPLGRTHAGEIPSFLPPLLSFPSPKPNSFYHQAQKAKGAAEETSRARTSFSIATHRTGAKSCPMKTFRRPDHETEKSQRKAEKPDVFAMFGYSGFCILLTPSSQCLIPPPPCSNDHRHSVQKPSRT